MIALLLLLWVAIVVLLLKVFAMCTRGEDE